MKKILLASTILVGSAGVAAADVSFSGSAYMGLGTLSQGALWVPLASASATASMSGETDGGLGFGASFKISGGGATGITTSSTSFWTYSDAGAVNTNINLFCTNGGGTAISCGNTTAATVSVTSATVSSTVSGNAGSVGDLSVWISGDFGKVSLTADASDPTTVIGYTGTFGGFTVSGAYTTGAIAPVDSEHGDWNIKLAYASGDYSAYYKHAFDASGNSGTGMNVDTIGGSASFGDFGVSASFSQDNLTAGSRTGWDLGVSWSSGAISAGVDIGQNRPTGFNTMGISLGYDLGGGASVDFAYSDLNTAINGAATEMMKLGVSMSF